MANPFTAFKFPASGSGVNTNISMPDRLAYIKDVKDFGAVGDGVTNDLAAIQAAVKLQAPGSAASKYKGVVYFPPGTYLVSAPIDFYLGVGDAGEDNCHIQFIGEQGLSTITGNFADYVFSRLDSGGTGRAQVNITIEKLNITNTNALGGGIRLGAGQGCAIRDCTITANKGIDTDNDDTQIGGAYWGSFEVAIDNCVLSPGSNATSSQGMLLASDGPVTNCRLTGFVNGIQTFGGEGAVVIMGCYFEQNGTAIYAALAPNLTSDTTADILVSGCWFKNNSVALQGNLARFTVEGCRIEGANGAAPGGLNPQYGILLSTGFSNDALFRGINVLGQYDHAGIYVTGGEVKPAPNTTFMGVQSVSWQLPSTSFTAAFIGCNIAPVYTVSELPFYSLSISNAVYNAGSGLTTFTTSAAPGGSWNNAMTWAVTVSGVTPSGFNFSTPTVATPTGASTFTVSIGNPGSYTSGGTVLAIANNDDGTATVFEGDCYDVSDGTNSLAWAAALTNTGSHTTHYKARWNGSNFAVVGQ